MRCVSRQSVDQVASPKRKRKRKPKRIFEIRPIKWLLEKSSIVICAGGGGIPTMYTSPGKLEGVEAVIDKDLYSALLAEELDADLLVIATDVSAAFVDFGKPSQKTIVQAHPDEMEKLGFAAGSMGPKVQAACEFARHTGKVAVIGTLSDIETIVQGTAGTRISTATPGITYLKGETSMATFEPGHLHIERHALNKEDVSYNLCIDYEIATDPKDGKGMQFTLHGTIQDKALTETFFLPKDQAYNFASNVTKIAEKYGVPKGKSSIASIHTHYDAMFEDVRSQLDMKSGDPVDIERLE